MTTMARPSRNLSARKELPGARLLAFCQLKPRLERLTGLHWKNMLSRVINSTEHDPLLVGVSSHTQVRTVGIAFRTAAACQIYEPRPVEHVGVLLNGHNHRGQRWMMKGTFRNVGSSLLVCVHTRDCSRRGG